VACVDAIRFGEQWNDSSGARVVAAKYGLIA
jgi:hypothetical protein